MDTKKLLWIPAIAGLVLTILPAFLTFWGAIPFEQHKVLMTIGVFLWFFTAPFALRKKAE